MFDLFYKIKTLHHLGVKIHLHCFEYGRGEQPELSQYCEEIHYYKRVRKFPIWLPYIVISRKNPRLIKNILKDNYPVLLEGIHCTYYLYHGELEGRKVLVRLHNVEYQYYQELAKSTNYFYKYFYYKLESRLLKKYEKIIAQNAKLIAVNKKDQLTYQHVFAAKDIEFLPVFLPFEKVRSEPGNGNFCLYHGNLSVSENEKAAIWILKNITNHLINYKFIFAGKNPSQALKNETAKNKNVQLIENPSEKEMSELITNAHIHLIPSFNSTGIKIKLLNALFNGRFIITNAASVNGTTLESLCYIEEIPTGYIKRIEELQQICFDKNELTKRKELLENLYQNEKNAIQLMKWL